MCLSLLRLATSEHRELGLVPTWSGFVTGSDSSLRIITPRLCFIPCLDLLHPWRHQVWVGRWDCDAPACRRTVEYDGNADSVFAMRRRNKHRQWLLFTRGVVDKIISFIIAGRTTYTAATRHVSSDVRSFTLRRQDVVKLGTMAIRTVQIPPGTGRCPRCGPSPAFVVIDAQALGCSDADNANPFRPADDCPVLDIPASNLCIVKKAALRGAVLKVLRSSTPLTSTQVGLLREWRGTISTISRPTPEAAAATVFFRFFPLGVEAPEGRDVPPVAAAADAPAQSAADAPAQSAADDPGPRRKRARVGSTLEDALRLDAAGNTVLGGNGPPAKKALETWRDRTGICAPAFKEYSRSDDGVWICVRPFLQAMLAETVTGMFLRKDTEPVTLLANTLRLMSKDAWKKLTKAVDDVGFLTSFLGRFADDMDDDVRFRKAVGELLLQAIVVERYVDDTFEEQAILKSKAAPAWKNKAYCERWKNTPTPEDYKRWRAEQKDLDALDEDDPLVSFEFFASLPRVRPGIVDSVAAKRRVGYRGKDRHVADAEGDGDTCNKAFSITAGLSQGVFNVVCPHVVTLGFRCLFRAESVGEALSIVLERFASLPTAIFYDVACKIDKNAMRRVRVIMRAHGVRCILDRPHSITHSCSPVYMPDESLGTTAGVATQAAEVSHSVSVVNRTSLAYMAPATYMSHRMVQVAFMNLRKIYRLHADNSAGENDHIPLSPFFHAKIAHQCERISVCPCDAVESSADVAAALAGQHDAQDVNGGAIADPASPPPPGLDAQYGDARAADADATGGEPPQDPEEDGPSEDQLVAATVVADQVNTNPAHVQLQAEFDALADAGADGSAKALISTPVTRAEARLVNEITGDRDGAEVIRLVNKARITLRVADMELLKGVAWLNDELMNSFSALINHRSSLRTGAAAAAADGGHPLGVRVCMLSTYFYSKLSARMGCYDYDGVRQWGKKRRLDLEEVDLVLVPINLARCHWVLVTVDIKHRTFHYYDSLGAVDSRGAVANVQRWLGDEVRSRLGDETGASWAVESWRTVFIDRLPEQHDGGSCGVFVLAAADCLSLGVPLHFSQKHIEALRHRIALALFFDSLFSLGFSSALSVPPEEPRLGSDGDDA